MGWDLTDNKLTRFIETAEYGIEKESLRVTPEGRLAQTPHPFSEPYLDRDFCEDQTEMITSVHRDVDSLFDELTGLHRIVNRKLEGMNELLWSFSNPPVVMSQEEIPIARFYGELSERGEYRRYLAQKYGKAKMLFSGIHFNFSFSEELLRAASGGLSGDDLRLFKDDTYTELCRKLLPYTWLIVYLTAASPLMDKSFMRISGLSEADRYRYASARCSQVGYWNDFLPVLDFSDAGSYADSIQRYIDSGRLYAASELYYPLRLKPAGKNSLDSLRENGVNHIELRCLDVNPLSIVGLIKEDIRFIHLLLLYLMSLPDCRMGETEQGIAIENIKTAALYNDAENRVVWNGARVPVRTAARSALDDIGSFAEEYAPMFKADVGFQKEKLSGWRYVDFIRDTFKDYIGDGLKLAERYRGQSCV